MKRLVEVTGQQELKRGVELQEEYKDSRRMLEKQVKSLRNYKGINKQLKGTIERMVPEVEAVIRFKVEKAVRRSALDYYSIMTEDIVVGMVSHLKFICESCETTITKSRQLKQNALKTLQQTDKVFQQKTQSHQKLLKDYIQSLYPDTKGLLFKLHLKSTQNFQKNPNPALQQQMLKQATVYNSLVEDCINTYEDLRRLLEECCETGLYGLRDTWIKSAEEMSRELAKMQVTEEEVGVFVEGLKEKENRRGRSRSRSRETSRSTHHRDSN